MDIYYNPLDLKCKSIRGGIKQNEHFDINVYGDNSEPCLFVLKKDGGEAQYLPMQKIPGGWSITLVLHDPGLYFYYFIVGKRKAGCGEFRNIQFADSIRFYQILVYKENFITPEWLKGGIMYQIFPDRFNKSGSVKIPKGKWLHASWDEQPEYRKDANGKVLNNDFFGGNLRGIAEKIDYLKSLNVTLLYLNPIFEAFSNHRYDTGDYKKIDPILGSEEDFVYLIQKCAENGIRIMLDGVFNHTGDDSRYFNKYGHYDEIGAYQSQDSKYYAWYNFTNFPNRYDSWWGIDVLPAVNENCDSYIDFITGKNGVIQYWLQYGLAGYRLDVADELPDEFIEKIRSAVKEINSNAVVLGEVWEDASNKIAYGKRRKYFQGSELDSVMNYPLKDAIIQFILSNDTALLAETITMLQDNYPKQVLDILMNILGTHDTARIITVLGQIPAHSKDEMSLIKMDNDTRLRAKECLKAAALLLFTLPGIPCIYYGDEIGMEGYSDPFCRRPFAWNNIDEDLLRYFQRLSQIRSELNVFKDSDYTPLFLDKNCLVFERRTQTQVAVVCVNRGYNKYEIRFSGSLYDLLENKQVDEVFTIKPQSYSVLSNFNF